MMTLIWYWSLLNTRDPSSCEESSSLRQLLDHRDASLGPWTPGRFVMSLLTFDVVFNCKQRQDKNSHFDVLCGRLYQIN
jgi:hypothetical protein